MASNQDHKSMELIILDKILKLQPLLPVFSLQKPLKIQDGCQDCEKVVPRLKKQNHSFPKTRPWVQEANLIYVTQNTVAKTT